MVVAAVLERLVPIVMAPVVAPFVEDVANEDTKATTGTQVALWNAHNVTAAEHVLIATAEAASDRSLPLIMVEHCIVPLIGRVKWSNGHFILFGGKKKLGNINDSKIWITWTLWIFWDS